MTSQAIAGSGRKTGTDAEPVLFSTLPGISIPGWGRESPAIFSETLMKKIIESRLAKLPPKVAQPLKHLAKIGQMREEDIKTVLDAGDLTGNYHTLVGFAAGAMGMKAQRVPVADTVAMAKKLGRQIRLDWSPRRWREEHDRMAKAVTLRQFSEENVDYDVEFFASKLPTKYPGYIIRNSRRLATIGWYQRHCVAGYHPRCLDGSSAFVCVFVDRIRWTVELNRTGHPENPIRINQIRTTDNGCPEPPTEKRIYDYLGIGENMYEYDEYLQRRLEEHQLRQVTVANLSRVHQALAEAGVEYVYMYYDPNPDNVPLLALPEIMAAPASKENFLETPVELFTPSESRNESGQLVIEMQKETIENALRQLQQKLMAERREREYRWRAPPKREHYALKLDVANRFLEILQTTSNGITLQAQVETSTMNVGIEECPDIDGLLQAA